MDEEMVPPEELHPYGHGSNGETDSWVAHEKQDCAATCGCTAVS